MISLGVALVLLGVLLALYEFMNVTVSPTASSSLSTSFADVLNVAAYMLVKIGFLAVIVWGGSLLIGKALQMTKIERESLSEKIKQS
jgi:nitrate reductase gamma subunit